MASDESPNRSALTDVSFWDTYWSGKENIGKTIVPRRYLFSDVFTKVCRPNYQGRFLEIGGFPGYFSIWFSKYCHCKASLLDIYIKRDVVDSLIKVNGIESIETIEASIFDYEPEEKFDIVLSAGLIEHFDDLDAIISCHKRCLDIGGRLIVCVPNFLGLNGLLQRIVDQDNFKAHNLAAMDVTRMCEILAAQGFLHIAGSYYGGFGVWIEDARSRARIVRLALRAINLLRLPLTLLKFNTRLFAPYIVYTATNG